MSLPPPLDTRLAQAILAYRIGRALPIAMSAGPSGALFRDLAQDFIRARLPEAEYRRFAAVREWCREAVEHGRVGDWDTARVRFAAAEEEAAAGEMGEAACLLCRSWIDQAFSYFAARQQDWQAARRRLRAAMAADLALEEEHGFGIFHIARVHTVHLLLRIEASAGRVDAAIHLAQAIVDYVTGMRSELPEGAGWSAARAIAVPEVLRNAMIARIASEVGTQLALLSDARAAILLPCFSAWQRMAGHSVLDEIHVWGQAKTLLAAGDTDAFLTRARPLLAAGRGETMLWYACALDLCRVCAALRPCATEVFRHEVASDARRWRELPAPLLSSALRERLAANTDDATRHAYRHRAPQRRFRAYTVGLPRTGTTSLYTLFAAYRAGNEFMERQTVQHCVRRRRGEISEDAFRDYLHRRDREGGLEMDSASFNHLYLDLLIEEFPEARFIHTLREPGAWVNSYLKMLMAWRARFAAEQMEMPDWMTQYGRLLFGDFDWAPLSSRAALEPALPTLVDRFVRHWAEANGRIQNLLPPERSLLVRTETLSEQRAEIARFVGVPPDTLTDAHHSNASLDRGDLLAGLKPGYLESLVERYAGDFLRLPSVARP